MLSRYDRKFSIVGRSVRLFRAMKQISVNIRNDRHFLNPGVKENIYIPGRTLFKGNIQGIGQVISFPCHF